MDNNGFRPTHNAQTGQTERQEPDDGHEPRKRRLDELFADEPWLSPTMRARRLHEKIREAENGVLPVVGEATQGLPAEAYVKSVKPAPTLPEATDLADGLESVSVSLVDAAQFLRGKKSLPEVAEKRLRAFRDAQLYGWLQESESSTEGLREG
jgi:hypothetical protein